MRAPAYSYLHQGMQSAAAFTAIANGVCAAQAITASKAVDRKQALLASANGFTSPLESVSLLAAAEGEWTWQEEHYRYNAARERSQPNYVGGYCMDNLAMALHCVHSTDSFRAATLKAANMCGDADSVCAVCADSHVAC